MKYLIILLSLTLCCVQGRFLTSSASSAIDKFRNHTPLKKLSVQALATFMLFKDQFMKRMIKNQITSPEMKKRFLEGMQAVEDGENKSQGLFGPIGGDEDPQMHLDKLAFMYTVMNRADFATATAIDRVCSAENLLSIRDNSNVCNTYPSYLLKLIELRLGIVSSRVIFSEGLVGIPKGWLEHVQGIIRELERTALLSESLRNLLYLLQAIAKKTEEVDEEFATSLLKTPESVTDNGHGHEYGHGNHQNNNHHHHNNNNNSSSHHGQMPTKITIDARNLTKALSKKHFEDRSETNKHSNDTLDSMISQVLPKMMMI